MKEKAGLVLNKKCGLYIISCQQQEISCLLITGSEICLDLSHFDLKGLLPEIFQDYKYFLLIKNNSTTMIFLKFLWSKKEAFKKLL